MKKFYIVLIFLLTSIAGFAQKLGNEWINFSQDYYKIKIGKEGIYKIDYNALQSIGFPVGSVNPQYIQLWRNGEEVPVIVAGENDGVFDNADFIEFYGTYNDGSTDSALYPIASEQPHQYMSLYSDTATYFLTISATQTGKRVTIYNNTNYAGKTADAYFNYEQAIWYNNKNSGQSYDGLNFSTEGFHSEYTEGEGWALQFDGGGTKLSFLTPFLYTSGPLPYLEVLAHSRANNTTNYDIDGFNNGVQLAYDPSGTIINSKRVKGYGRYFFTDSLNKSLFGAQKTTFKISSYLLAKSVHSLSYMKLIYPRQFNLNDSATLKFSYTSGNNFIKFQKYSSKKTNPVVYDIKNFTKATAQLTGTDLYCNLSPANTNKTLLIVDESNFINIPASNIKPFKFNQISVPAGVDYLIITNQVLDSGAKAYSAFLSSTLAGKHNVFIAYSDQLYDQFYYGLKHPMALKNFCRTAINAAPGLKYLLLLGKGQKYPNTRFNPSVSAKFDLVPTYGIPPTDYFFTSGFNGSMYNPLLATGRVPATTNKQIANYLTKLNSHYTTGYEPWKKRVLQLAGGNNASEVGQFSSYQEIFYNIIRDQYWGATRKLITKEDPSPVDSTLKSKIQNEINQGYAMVDYFGHGSTQASDIDLGEAYQLSNTNKYPFFYFNGCGLGNTFDGTSIAEDFIFTRDKGAIGWMAGSTFGYISELYFFANLFHTNLTKNTAASFAENIAKSMQQYQMTGNDFNRAQCRQMLYMGDPSINMIEADKPDFAVESSKISMSPANVTAEADSFALKIPLLNNALYTNDSFSISIQQTIPGGTVIKHRNFYHQAFAYSDTLMFWIKKPAGVNIKGLNTFTIQLDSANAVAEQLPNGETNNTGSFQYYFSSTSAQILFPRKDGIVNKNNIDLIAQSLNYTGQDYNFVFELDTTPKFNSPYLKNSGNVKSSYIAKANFTLLPTDSIDYYWRVKIDDGSGNIVWDVSTFSMINNSQDGWSQGYFSKFADSKKDRLAYDSTRNLEFVTTQSSSYTIETSGRTSTATYRTIWHEGYPLYFGYLTTGGILAVAINPKNEERFYMNSKFNVLAKSKWWGDPTNYLKQYYETPGVSKSCAYFFNTYSKPDRDSLILFLKQIPDGYHLMIITGQGHYIPFWEKAVFDELAKFGAIKASTVIENEPYILVGQKGMKPGEAIEKLADPTNPLPGKDQYIFVNTTLNILSDSGQITSGKIGPSRQWKQFYKTIKSSDNASDKVRFNLYGIKVNGQRDLLFNDITDHETDLTGVDAQLYPYMQIEADIVDKAEKTPTGINRWTILFDGVPEGVINPQVTVYQNKDTLSEGDTLKTKIAYTNISSFDMDSVLVLTTIENSLNQTDTLEFKKYPNLDASKGFEVKKSMSTIGYAGLNKIRVSVNPDMEQQEEYLFNNVWEFPFFVERDKKNPYLDVVFDGRHITNLEIISPKPVITMTATDDNYYMFIDDPSYYTVKLKYPGAANFVTLDTYSDTFTFVPAKGPGQKASLIYSPIGLKDGTYEMHVAIKDAAGNYSPTEEYTISFQVISKSTITNVLPYPNPFTTSTRFVFTLTGEKVPEQFKITILTVSGHIVKEINQDEMGPMNIGNNISSYEWNGTDMYGDKLANGLYLYKVSAKIDGKDIESSEAAMDSYFTKGFGKLYIMR